jgi:hypothetical protein
MADNHLNCCNTWNNVTKSFTAFILKSNIFIGKLCQSILLFLELQNVLHVSDVQQETVSLSFPPYTRCRDISISRKLHKRIDLKSETIWANSVKLFPWKLVEFCGCSPYCSLCHWYLDLMHLLLALDRIPCLTFRNSTFNQQICFIFLCGSQNKQLLFMHAALNVCFYNRDWVCLLCGTSIIFMCNSDFLV